MNDCRVACGQRAVPATVEISAELRQRRATLQVDCILRTGIGERRAASQAAMLYCGMHRAALRTGADRSIAAPPVRVDPGAHGVAFAGSFSTRRSRSRALRAPCRREWRPAGPSRALRHRSPALVRDRWSRRNRRRERPQEGDLELDILHIDNAALRVEGHGLSQVKVIQRSSASSVPSTSKGRAPQRRWKTKAVPV